MGSIIIRIYKYYFYLFRICHNDDIKVNATCVMEKLATWSGVDVLK